MNATTTKSKIESRPLIRPIPAVRALCSTLSTTAALALGLLLVGCPGKGQPAAAGTALHGDPASKTLAAATTPEAAPVSASTTSGQAASPGGSSALGEGSWVQVTRGSVERRHPTIGMFRARQTTKLGSQVSGRVLEVLVDVGDPLKAGQELIRLDPAFFRIEVAQKKADVDAAKVALDDAELNLKRMKSLWDKPDGKDPSIPRKLFDDAKTRTDSAAAHLEQARQALAKADENLKESVIRAPYDGVVARRVVDPGEPVTSAPITDLMVVQEIDRLDLEFSLPQEMLTRVRPGTRVEFEAEGAGAKGSGAVAVVFPSLDEATRSIRCRLTMDNKDLRFRPGLLVKVEVIEDEVKDALVIPSGALTRTTGGWQVVVLADGKPDRRSIRVGIRAEERLEVKDGLTEGDRVWVPRTAMP